MSKQPWPFQRALLPLTALLTVVTFTLPLRGEKRAMTLLDVIGMPQLVDPQISPDGKQILFVQSRADWKANRRVQHLWRVNADGSGLIQMTNGLDGENTPLWSPDGKTVAFLSKRGTTPESVAQLYVMAANGGEGSALTNHATPVTNPAWAPDGATL